MKNNRMDDWELERLTEGLSRTQIELLKSLLEGRAALLAKKHAAKYISKWKPRPDYRWN
jgi:hypothetical protein